MTTVIRSNALNTTVFTEANSKRVGFDFKDSDLQQAAVDSGLVNR